jgi:23S rRNA (pseudouridine1915-N3)-methyltransferase
MRLTLLAAGTKLPNWINDGFKEYAERLSGEYRLELREIPVAQRSGADIKQALNKERDKMISAIPSNAYVVALQVQGKMLASEELADFLQVRAQDGRDVVFCIGGPDGIPPEVDARANFRWSLSTLTLPHALARVVVAEALYRAVMIIRRHPYHRAG